MNRLIMLLRRAGFLLFCALTLVSGCGGEKGQEAGGTVTQTVVVTETDATGEDTDTGGGTEDTEAVVVVLKSGVAHGDTEVGYGLVLKNQSKTQDAIDVTITVNAVDAKGDIVVTEAERVNVVPAGATYYLGGGTYSEGEAKAVKLESIVDVGKSEPAAYPLPKVQKVRIEDQEYLGLRVKGEVVNTLDEPLSSFAKIGIVLFDSAGEVVGGGFAFLDAELPPGGRAGFESGNGVGATPASKVKFVRVSVNNEVTS